MLEYMENTDRKYKSRNIRHWIIFYMKQFLFQRVSNSPPTPIITSPELQIYVHRFGETKDDLELVAEIVGAVWVRIMNNYEHIDYETLLIINRCITMTMMTGLLRVIALMKKGMKKIIVTNGKKLNISHLIN